MAFPSVARVLLLLVGFVLVVSGGATAFADVSLHSPVETQSPDEATSPSSLDQVDGTTNYMQIPASDVRTAGFSRSSVDVTTATKIDSNRLHVQLDVESFRIRYDDADTVANRTTAVRDIVRSLENDSERIHHQQTTAHEQYNRDEMTEAEFLGVLMRSDAASEDIRAASRTVLEADEETVEYEIQPELETRLEKLEVNTLPMSGSVRSHTLEQMISGSGAGTPTYIESSDDMIVLATIADGAYVREAFDREAFDPDGAAQLSISDVVSRAETLYPWTMDSNNRDDFSVDTLWNTSAFAIQIQHDRGELDAYLDASTTDVFREDQRLDLEDIPTETVVTNATSTAELTVNSTHETGPLQVSLTRPDTTNPVEGDVYVDDTYVGATGDDGTLWTIDTRGETNVRVETDDGVLSAEIPANATAD